MQIHGSLQISAEVLFPLPICVIMDIVKFWRSSYVT